MLVVSSLRDSTTSQNDKEETIESMHMDDFSEFSTGSLIDSIDFDELFPGFDDDSDMLPDLEILGDYSIGETGDEQGLSSDKGEHDENDVLSCSGSGSVFGSPGQDISSSCSVSEEAGVADNVGEIDLKSNERIHVHIVKSKKPIAPATKAGRSKTRCSDGTRKAKVDWTPELHKRFVQAVEQLGEKAVPSRILEVMGTDGLTRHNIASHLQKYRSHRKHLIAREVEVASWNQTRHVYSVAASRGVEIGKRVVNPWILPTVGFPPSPSMPQPVHHLLKRQLHVWGNTAQTVSNMWSKHVVPHHLRPPHLQPQPVWVSPRPLPYGPTQGMPCFQPHSQGFVAAPAPGLPNHTLYKNPNAATGQTSSLPPPLYSTPSNERIDAALEDVLAKPWLPLPIGLKPPAIDTVLGELQRQGVPQIPPSYRKRRYQNQNTEKTQSPLIC